MLDLLKRMDDGRQRETRPLHAVRNGHFATPPLEEVADNEQLRRGREHLAQDGRLRRTGDGQPRFRQVEAPFRQHERHVRGNQPRHVVPPQFAWDEHERNVERRTAHRQLLRDGDRRVVLPRLGEGQDVTTTTQRRRLQRVKVHKPPRPLPFGRGQGLRRYFLTQEGRQVGNDFVFHLPLSICHALVYNNS